MDTKPYVIGETNPTQGMNSSYQSDVHYREPPPSYYAPAIQSNDRTLTWCERQQKYKPQSNTVAGGVMLMLVSGLHIGWGIYRFILDTKWMIGHPPIARYISVILFYAGINIGSLIGAKLLEKLEKKRIYYIGGVLFLLSSILFTAGPNQLGTIITGRLLAGLGHGIVYLTTIIHASENSVKDVRGLILASIDYCIVCSIFTATAFNIIPYTYDSYINIDSIIGIMGILYSLMAIGMIPCFTYESIVYLLIRGRDSEAIANMMKLRTESIETWDIRKDYQEMKLMLQEDEQETDGICGNGNGHVFLIVLAAKILKSLATCYMINFIMMAFISTSLQTSIIYAGLILILPRFIIQILPMFLTDYFGRRKLLLSSGLLTSICFILMGILSSALVLTWDNISVFLVLALIGQACIGIGIGPIPDVIMSEAFSTKKKIKSMRIIIIIEQIVQIIPIAITYNVEFNDTLLRAPLFVFGFLILGLTILLFFKLPECKRLSLREARIAYRNKCI